jgi:hypothetical protein
MSNYHDDMFVLEPGAEKFSADEEIEGPRAISEKVPLFEGLHNPNHDIFVVPTQEGADRDDQWNGSIGDATMEHIYQMRHKIMEMEHFVHMPNGNIFRVEQNVAPPDEDGARSMRNQILKVMTAPTGRQGGRTVTMEDKERVIEFLKAEIEEAKKAREEKADALDQVLVPFEEWENMPQQTNNIDIPSTPTPLYIFAGNSSQMFYDFVPEDHPDLRKLNGFLSMANAIDWDDFNENTVEYFRTWIYGQEWNHYYAAERLVQLCNEIALATSEAPSDLAEAALRDIENDWVATLRPQVIDEFFANDPIIQELRDLEVRLQANKKEGKLSWAEIGKFGQLLYKKYGTRMTTVHWRQYKNLKKQYAPEVRLGKIDVNRANLHQLRDFFAQRYRTEIDNLLFGEVNEVKAQERMSVIKKEIEDKAHWMFFNRPFMTLEDLAASGAINVDDIGHTKNTVVLVSLVKKAYRESLNFKSSAPLGRIAQQIVNYQRSKPGMCTEQEWFSIWQAYRICKGIVGKTLGITPK